MPRKKSKKNMYFDMDVQDAIVRYNLSEDDNERNKIYGKEIHAAFDKLCENIINTFKFTYFDDGFEDVKQEVTSFLVMNMHKYFKKKKDLDVAFAIIELINRREEIENFNKKALYILIREMTNVETSHITKVTNTMKKQYRKLLNEYSEKGLITIQHTSSSFF